MFGKTRQSWYYKQQVEQQKSEEYFAVYGLIMTIRADMPKLGVRKVYYILQNHVMKENLSIGRDKLYELMREWGLLVKTKRKGKQTTYSNHWLKKYPNLIADKRIYRPNQVWVSDITYIHIGNEYAYLSLITDAYSKKIVGYYLHDTLNREGPIKSLKMALKQKGKLGVTHHSDRGIQYCSHDYVSILEDNFIKISMTDKGSPYQNAVAERVNGILKHEFGCKQIFDGIEVAKSHITKAIEKYNGIRPHLSCGYLTPNKAHATEEELKHVWKNYYKENVKL